jgi:hypothetical protein
LSFPAADLWLKPLDPYAGEGAKGVRDRDI